MAENEPNEAEMAEFARQMQEQLRSLTAAELLSQTGITLVNVAAARTGHGRRRARRRTGRGARGDRRARQR